VNDAYLEVLRDLRRLQKKCPMQDFLSTLFRAIEDFEALSETETTEDEDQVV